MATDDQRTAPSEHSIKVNRSARYFTLGGPLEADEVWIVLHGYGQLAREFVGRFESIVTSNRMVVAPEGLSRFYHRAGQGAIGANWMTSEDRLNEISDYVAYLDSVVEDLGTRSTCKYYVLGFSQGSATACRWFALSKLSLEGIVIWGGGVPPDLNDDAFIENLGNGGVLHFVYGTSDQFLSSTRVRSELRSLEERAIPSAERSFDGGHDIDVEVLAEVVNDMGEGDMGEGRREKGEGRREKKNR